MTVAWLILGLLLLFAGAELLVGGAARVARALGVSPLIIGLTVVAFGTSAPELAVSVGAAIRGQDQIAVANVVGSNTFNVFLVLGVCALWVPLRISRRLVQFDVPVMIAASMLLWAMGRDGAVSRMDGLLLVGSVALYLVGLHVVSRRRRIEPATPQGGCRTAALGVPVARILAGLTMLVLGSRWLVDSAQHIALALGVSPFVIGVTIVAAGTSLPELATSLVAAGRRHSDIAVGNIVGSNIFNLLAVLGVSAAAAPSGLKVAPEAAAFDIPVMIGAAVLCLPVFLSRWRIARWEGALFVSCYVVYVGLLAVAVNAHRTTNSLRPALLCAAIPVALLTVMPALRTLLHPSTRRRLSPEARERLQLAAVSLALLAGIFGSVLAIEFQTSRFQSVVLHDIAREMSFRLEDGPSPSIRFPTTGPYNLRLGYDRIPGLVDTLASDGYRVTRQARISKQMRKAVDAGLSPVYREKDRTGLRILDGHGSPLFEASYPDRTFTTFDDIPPVVVSALLYIENRDLLERDYPYRNPAVEWGRTARSVAQLALRQVGREGPIEGGSTLATQLEKFRHSPGGVTSSPPEKLRQMATASLRAYQADRETVEAQKRVVLDYLNSVPLSAVEGYGEVNGLGAGLRAWFGMELNDVAILLRDPQEADPGTQADQGRAFRAVLALLLAESRPSYYLRASEGQAVLDRRVKGYLAALARDQIVPASLLRAAASAQLRPSRQPAMAAAPVSFTDRKGANAIRSRLLDLFGVERLYDLDRWDLTVGSTLDRPAQNAVTMELRRLTDPKAADSAGLVGPRLLTGREARHVRYALLLMEATPEGNAVRVQTDNYDAPLDLNQATKLELGSTAKLRTLATYLEIVEELHRQMASLDAPARDQLATSFNDPLTRWATDWFRRNPDSDVEAMLHAAMQRTYSASPGEVFFTGGGLHAFSNLDDTYDAAVLTVQDAFANSVNLVFIRLMRDVVRYQTLRIPGSSARALLESPDEPLRREYLARFADREGRTFVNRFYAKLSGAQGDEILDRVVGGRRLSPIRLARVYRAVRPDADVVQLRAFLGQRAAPGGIDSAGADALFRRCSPEAMSWADLGFLTGVHPLELWVARYLTAQPDARRSEVVSASAQVRQEVYRWLFVTSRRTAQDQRIRTMLEVEAFMEIGRRWQRLGYPFDNLVPSLATAIGSSGDRPTALAELVGIIVNDGVRRPTIRIESFAFGSGTPYETVLQRVPATGERVLSPQVAAVLRDALVGVVENGSARRVSGAFHTADGARLIVGGKTGTGDNRYQLPAPDGRSAPTRIRNRTATFAFFIGDCHFGVVTAFVEGADADVTGFTSSLVTQLLRDLAPVLEPLVRDPGPSNIVEKASTFTASSETRAAAGSTTGSSGPS